MYSPREEDMQDLMGTGGAKGGAGALNFESEMGRRTGQR